MGRSCRLPFRATWGWKNSRAFAIECFFSPKLVEPFLLPNPRINLQATKPTRIKVRPKPLRAPETLSQLTDQGAHYFQFEASASATSRLSGLPSLFVQFCCGRPASASLIRQQLQPAAAHRGERLHHTAAHLHCPNFATTSPRNFGRAPSAPLIFQHP